MDHFTKGQTIKKHSGVSDDRQGGLEEGTVGRGGAESFPLRQTFGPRVLLLLHFQTRQHFDKTVQEQLDTDWPTYKNHYYLTLSCKANELWSLAHWLHLSAMNDRSECPAEGHLNKMADISAWAPHVILMGWILSPGAHNKLSISSVWCGFPCEPLMRPGWATSGSTSVTLTTAQAPLCLHLYLTVQECLATTIH